MTSTRTWNTGRGTWEFPETALCGHAVAVTGTWPHTGIMLNAHATTSLTEPVIGTRLVSRPASDVLLPTPTVADTRDGRHVRDMSIQAMQRGSSKGINLNHLFEAPEISQFIFTAWGTASCDSTEPGDTL